MSAHVVANYIDALRCLTDVTTGSFNEQHREMRLATRTQDNIDLKKFVTYLQEHKIFKRDDSNSLTNIATGVVADIRVNADESVMIGWTIHDKMSNMKYENVSLKKNDQAMTFKVMRKPVSIMNDKVYMSSFET